MLDVRTRVALVLMGLFLAGCGATGGESLGAEAETPAPVQEETTTTRRQVTTTSEPDVAMAQEDWNDRHRDQLQWVHGVLGRVMEGSVDSLEGRDDFSSANEACTDLSKWPIVARDIPDPPDPVVESLWEDLIAAADRASIWCPGVLGPDGIVELDLLTEGIEEVTTALLALDRQVDIF